MTAYVALLRGINVGRNKQVSMADLRDVVESVGHGDVRTHLRSGNIIFTSKSRNGQAIATELERHLEDRLGLSSRVIVRSRAQLEAIVRNNPLPDATTMPAKLHVVFLEEKPPAAAVRAFDPDRFKPDEVHFAGREIYAWYPNGFATSKLNDTAWKSLGVMATARNWNTVTKLLALVTELDQP
jgi:uncharacterized protein (DUF1697 family)